MFQNLLGWGKLLFQAGDFIVKAITSYADTEAGAKEWGDVVAAFVELGLFAPEDLEQGVTVTSKAESETPLTLEEIERISETFNKPVEQEGEHPSAARRVVHRMRLSGEVE